MNELRVKNERVIKEEERERERGKGKREKRTFSIGLYSPYNPKKKKQREGDEGIITRILRPIKLTGLLYPLAKLFSHNLLTMKPSSSSSVCFKNKTSSPLHIFSMETECGTRLLQLQNSSPSTVFLGS